MGHVTKNCVRHLAHGTAKFLELMVDFDSRKCVVWWLTEFIVLREPHTKYEVIELHRGTRLR